jgi:drug/metabolite transporter (DMT)-like permease
MKLIQKITPIPHLTTHLYLLGMAALWGASWPAGKVLVQAQGVLPMHAAMWRFVLSCLILLIWLTISNRGLPRLSVKQVMSMILAGTIGVFGYSYCFMAGLATVPAGRASLVVAFNPVVTMLCAALLFGEKLTGKIILGMVCGLAGGLVVMSHGAPWKLFTGGIGSGELLLFGCVLTWSTYTLLGKKLLQGIPPLTAITYTSCVGAIMLSIAAYTLEPTTSPWSLTGEVQSMIVFLALGATVLAYVWYFKGIATLGAATAASYIGLVPVFGVLCSVWYLNETADISLLAGGTMAIVGVFLMNHTKKNNTIFNK